MGTHAPTLAPGTRLGRYEILERLGSGAMGQVYLARDVSLNRRVAIKALGRVHLNRPDLRARFAREARAVAAISHPNVVQIFDINEEEDQPYFVMEYLKGTDVEALLQKRGKLTVSEAVAIGLSSALGLSEAAAAGVVHRDVKPANLFLTDRGTVKVTDFGLAKGFELGANLTGDGITLGTPDYMPPEQGQGLEVDSRADIYALGSTLFHLLSGRPPFRGSKEEVGYADVVVRHIKLPTPRLEDELPDIDPSLAALVSRMMSKNPIERPGYEEIVEQLREVALRINAALPQVTTTGTGALPALKGDGEAPAEGGPRRGRLPGWAVGLSVGTLVLFVGATILYVYVFSLPPPARPPSIEQQVLAGSGGGTGTAASWRERLQELTPPGSVLIVNPLTGPIAVSQLPVSPRQVRELAPEVSTARMTTLDGVVAAGLSLQDARRVTNKLGGRLPTSFEWLLLEASHRVRIWPKACEWVDDGPTRQARCYKGTRAVVRNIKLPYKNSLFRVVRLLERPR